jgi:hypothetical protein
VVKIGAPNEFVWDGKVGPAESHDFKGVNIGFAGLEGGELGEDRVWDGACRVHRRPVREKHIESDVASPVE